MNEVRIRRCVIIARDSDNGYLASVMMEVEVGGYALQFSGMRLVKLRDGRVILAMPSKKESDGSFKEFVRPINQPTRDFLEEAAKSEYKRLLGMGYLRGGML